MNCTEQTTLIVTQFDTLSKWSAVIWQLNGKPADLTGKTVQFAMDDGEGTDIVVATTDGVTVQPEKSFEFDITRNRVVDYSHDVEATYQLMLSTTGALPPELSTSRRYYAVLIDETSFKLSLTRNGPPISISDGGTGTHSYTVLGSVEYQPSDEAVENVGDYYGWFIVVSAGKTAHCPNGRTLRIKVVAGN
jgi:hypothetical protein